jgi:hypothetical protein
MRTLAGAIAGVVLAVSPTIVFGASDVDKTAMQKATADCKAQVKQYAQYNDTSWYRRRQMVKSCVNDALAKK